VDDRSHSRNAEQRFTEIMLALHVTDIPIDVDGTHHDMCLTHATGWPFITADGGANETLQAVVVDDPVDNILDARNLAQPSTKVGRAG